MKWRSHIFKFLYINSFTNEYFTIQELLRSRLIERTPPPRGGFLFTMFPHQEPGGRGPPSKNQVLRVGSSSSGFLVLRGGPRPPGPLRVEFLLKTDSGYPKDTGVTLFTLATPGNPLRYNTHRSAPPVSTLTHSFIRKISFSFFLDIREHGKYTRWGRL